MKRIGLLGGTFDPIHVGHLMCAEAARSQLQLDRVIFIPTAIPSHKPQAQASAKHRLAMIRLAIRGNSFFQLSSWEVEEKRAVYTTETLSVFQKNFPRATLYFMIGSDSLKKIDSWKTGRAVLTQAQFVMAERPGTPCASIAPSLRKHVVQLTLDPVAISSHSIRRQCAQNQSVRYQVTDPVWRYLQKHRLYRSAA